MYYILITVIIIIIILITVPFRNERGDSIDSFKVQSATRIHQNYLMTTDKHPTADQVYMHVKQEFPNISLGTVYRNLNLLTDIGEAVKISTPDGGDRFDGRLEPHNHFLCTKCGRLLDLELDMKASRKSTVSRRKNFDGRITSSSTLFYGECSDCIKKS